ncbi:hypothetical protein [uncultured Polaribacter sp.]|uniref:hypothetical protein n=1 Tax=uncultured Polaribacter sp. TaxID=174711 RepID=UPI00261E13DC|nr:hypothetical protein [uncultured Polaribacter sp.]
MKFLKTKFYLFFLCYCFFSCSEQEKGTPIIPDDELDSSTTTEIIYNAGCKEDKNPVFIENGGLVLVEFESSNFESTSWKFHKLLSNYSGDGYLVWEGADSFQEPGKGLLNFKIRITNPGTYRFIWRSYITEGTNVSEFNDSWLKIPDAKHFYGQKSDGNIVYPHGTIQDPIAASAGQATTDPEGSGKDGWFKIYMNTASTWHWQSSTSDNDGHSIYAVFETAGNYTVQVSGRSKEHGIDKFVLFNDSVSQNIAISNQTLLSAIICE